MKNCLNLLTSTSQAEDSRKNLALSGFEPVIAINCCSFSSCSLMVVLYCNLDVSKI